MARQPTSVEPRSREQLVAEVASTRLRLGDSLDGIQRQLDLPSRIRRRLRDPATLKVAAVSIATAILCSSWLRRKVRRWKPDSKFLQATTVLPMIAIEAAKVLSPILKTAVVPAILRILSSWTDRSEDVDLHPENAENV